MSMNRRGDAPGPGPAAMPERRRRRGGVAMMFALTATTLALAGGVAVDLAIVSEARSKAQGAADAAVLAAAGHRPAPGVDGGPVSASDANAQRRAVADRAFDANLADLEGALVVARSLDAAGANGWLYRVELTAPTAVMALFGVERLPVAVEAAATAGAGERMEFVIAHDITNSMFFSTAEFGAARDEMKALVDRLFAGATGDRVTGAVMPFSDRVRLPTALVGSHWTTGPQPSGWSGCLEPRVEPTATRPDRLTDAPTTGAGQAKFAFHQPVTHHERGGTLSYTTGCHGAPITPASRDPAALKTALDTMGQGGTGRMDEAMAWAWRLLSPRWSGDWGLAGHPSLETVPERRPRRIVVLVTDGRTEIYRYEVVPPSGPVATYGVNMGSAMGFSAMEAVCADMKAAGIEIHVLQLNGNASATPHFQACASPGRHRMIDDLADFQIALRAIGPDTGPPRLTR